MNAIALLQAALSLIVAINTAIGPIPDELRVQALMVANHAIEVAQDEIARIEADEADDADDEEEDNDDNMNEDNGNGNAGAGSNDEPADAPLGSIKITSEDRNTGLGRDYKAITDDSIERWDQASDMANILVLHVDVYDANGSKIRNAEVRVDATDNDQSKNLGGKNSYQYLFKTSGEHTFTFSADGVEDEVITVNAD